MTNVVMCRPVEMIFVDTVQMTELARDRGELRAEYIAETALECIAERLTCAEAAWAEGDFARLSKIARSISAASDQLGMETVSHVAAKVADTALTRDDVALAALVARLIRVGEGSLNAIWDIGHARL